MRRPHDDDHRDARRGLGRRRPAAHRDIGFPRGWVRRSVRGDCPLELCPAGAVGDLVAASEVIPVAELTGTR
nr:hypothetical protein [Pseudonocardia sp. C8]